MKHSLKQAVTALIAAALFLFGTIPVYAQDSVDALHNGPPPTLPTQAPAAPSAAPTSAPDISFEPLPSLANSSQAATPTPVTPEDEPDLPLLYPTDIQGVEENGIRWIIKRV